MAKTNVQYGSSIPASDVANILQQTDRQANGVQTWRQLFGNAALGYQSNLGTLQKDFSDAISQAYSSNLAQQGVIASSGLAAGSRNYLQENLSKELSSVYENYVNNYRKAQQEAQQSYSNEYGIIAEELGTRAKNIATLYNESAYDFLSYLYEQDKLKDLNLGWLTSYDEQDNTYNLLSKDELLNKLFDTETNEMNAYGREFFDAMFNFQGAKGINSFGRWLSETNPELAEWMLEQDIYDASGNTNLEKVKQIIGISGDYSSDISKYIDTRNIISKNNTYTYKDDKGKDITINFDLTSDVKYKKQYDKYNTKSQETVSSTLEKYENSRDEEWINNISKQKYLNEQIAKAAGKNYDEALRKIDEFFTMIDNTGIIEFKDSSYYKSLLRVKNTITKALNVNYIHRPLSERDALSLLKDMETLDFETIYNNAVTGFKQFGEDYHKQLVEQKDKDRNK